MFLSLTRPDWLHSSYFSFRFFHNIIQQGFCHTDVFSWPMNFSYTDYENKNIFFLLPTVFEWHMNLNYLGFTLQQEEGGVCHLSIPWFVSFCVLLCACSCSGYVHTHPVLLHNLYIAFHLSVYSPHIIHWTSWILFMVFLKLQ